MFPKFYLYLQLASIILLSKEEYISYYFSDDRETLFCDDLYDLISKNLTGEYKEFWDTLYNFDEGIDIYNSLLFRQNLCIRKSVINNNPYLQDNNYEKIRHILQTEPIRINPVVADINKVRFTSEYDLVNLSNILAYRFKDEDIDKYIEFMKRFNLTSNGEVIHYFYNMKKEIEEKANHLLQPNGYVDSYGKKKVLVYKK